MHEANCFVTLTYDDEHLPEDHSLDVKHWQDFAKRLRHHVGPFRYLHAGEYGDLRGRPHYHACLFGVDFHGERELWRYSGGNPLYVSPRLQRIWKHGFATIGALTFESAAYVARYCLKKINGKDADEHYTDKSTGLRRRSEYTTMSRRPGIGAEWYRKYGGEVYRDDQVIARGVPGRPPKFYDGMFEHDDPAAMARIRSRRAAKAAKHVEELTWERQRDKEKVAKAQSSLYGRRVE